MINRHKECPGDKPAGRTAAGQTREDSAMTIGEKIKKARKDKGWTQSELAEKLNVSPEAVSKWERGTYLPDEYNEEQLNDILGLNLMDDDGKPVNMRLFNEDHMSSYLKGRLNYRDFPNASRALEFAKEKHKGKTRDPKDFNIPYIIHPYTMTCHALAMGLEEDELLAALLLHDVCEDCHVPPEELPVCEEVQEVVALVTKPEDKTGFTEEEYYAKILQNEMACMVKCIDRCNNVSSMALAYGPERMKKYIRETEEFYPALLRKIKSVPKYSNAAWLLSYQIRSVLQTAKRIG